MDAAKEILITKIASGEWAACARDEQGCILGTNSAAAEFGTGKTPEEALFGLRAAFEDSLDEKGGKR